MSTLAIITARGGSKRIPGKNIREFCGKPIISYSIDAAIKSGVFEEVMVSTDSEEIAGKALKYGAVVPFFRSCETSGDYATTADVLLEVIDKYKENGKEFDSFCCIYPTAPLISSDRLKKAFELLKDNKADSVIPVVRYSFPPQRGLVINEDRLGYKYPQYASARSQDLEAVYHDCGQFYFCSTDSFLRYRSVFMPNTIPVILDELEVQDIDNYDDWKLAELKYNILRRK